MIGIDRHWEQCRNFDRHWALIQGVLCYPCVFSLRSIRHKRSECSEGESVEGDGGFICTCQDGSWDCRKEYVLIFINCIAGRFGSIQLSSDCLSVCTLPFEPFAKFTLLYMYTCAVQKSYETVTD